METLETVQPDYELERGKPIPSKLHGRLQAKLIGLLYVSCGQTHTIYSELSLTLAPLYLKQVPDIALYEGVVPYTTSDEITVSELPGIAIEILSPTQGLEELTDRIERYLAAGVKSCWLVLPGIRTVSVSTKPGEYQTFDRHQKLIDSVAGIELDLNALFQ
ncbi:Uma2 family endonuclease [Hymenobacter baengnokdamensis]|uniref:Uma2 family endonuclease n=1 Tax=Hymenobacter baengnokdamensis TaxID=2615203 RepID=UPI001245EC21|nr:Uma2 family endonuclease [Hymenobacter baengnokdamensis]